MVWEKIYGLKKILISYKIKLFKSSCFKLKRKPFHWQLKNKNDVKSMIVTLVLRLCTTKIKLVQCFLRHMRNQILSFGDWWIGGWFNYLGVNLACIYLFGCQSGWTRVCGAAIDFQAILFSSFIMFRFLFYSYWTRHTHHRAKHFIFLYWKRREIVKHSKFYIFMGWAVYF